MVVNETSVLNYNYYICLTAFFPGKSG